MSISKLNILISAGLFALAAVASPVSLQKRVACTNGAVVFAVRGSDPNWSSLSVDPQYADIGTPMTDVANAIISKAGGGSLHAIQYPAINPPTNGYQDYQQSVNMGIQALQNAVISYVNSCPNGRIFIMGYSQGGQVVSGALAGSQVAGPLKVHGRVTGVVTYADPGYITNVEPIDAGTAATASEGGTVTGQQNEYAYLKQVFGSRLRAYCQAGDAFCNSGEGQGGSGSQAALNIHYAETKTYQGAATAFLSGLIH